MDDLWNLFGWTEQTWLLVDQVGILVGNLVGFASIGLAVVGFLSRERLRRWFTRNHFPSVGRTDPGERQWDALVFTVSRTELPLWVAERHSPRWMGLIASPQSLDSANQIAARAKQRGISVVGPLSVDNPDDPAAARELTALVLRSLRRNGARTIAVDVTGGKTPMSLGAFMAAEEHGAETVYVSSKFDAALNRPELRSARLVGISAPRR